jgi:hypothetical protein
MTGTSTYRSWAAMKTRCSNPNCKDYQRYGGRGISYCDAWENFEAFYADMGEKPDGMTLERIDYDKGYSPENCRWATDAEQQQNKSTNVWLVYGGKRMILSEWSKHLSIPTETLRNRLSRTDDLHDAFYGEWAYRTAHHGVDNVNAKLTPEAVVKIRNMIAAGEKQKDVAKKFGVHRDTIRRATNGLGWKHIEEVPA